MLMHENTSVIPIFLSEGQASGYKTFFVLNSSEHEIIYPAHEC